MTLDGEKERNMKLTLMALGLAMAAGCAHGADVRSAATELRGSARVAESGRMLLAGTEVVHASVDGPRPVSLFVVERVHGDDRDCQTVRHPQSVSGTAHVEVGANQELCAVSSGPALVLWHAFAGERNNNLWALQ
jgi:hypothetical protein